MLNTKTCKQCGRSLALPNFRRYYPRGAAAQKQKGAALKVGYNTVCKECEAFNAKVNYIYKSSKRTQEQQKLLDDAAVFYKALADKGLEPKGRYASDILVDAHSKRASRHSDSIKDARTFMNSILEPTTNDALVDDYNKLLKLDLTEEPDVYQAMLDELRERSVGADGRVRPEYKEIFTKTAERIDAYEDNYSW